ncbi:tatD related DNase family protein, partial [Vibrio parahaemolyticus V-223/04]
PNSIGQKRWIYLW